MARPLVGMQPGCLQHPGRPIAFKTSIDPGDSCMRVLRLVWLGLASVGLALGSAIAGDWTEFRGPTGQGLFGSALPTKWTATEHIAWKQKLPGKGWSSPVILGGRIYLTTAVPAKDNTSNSLRV